MMDSALALILTFLYITLHPQVEGKTWKRTVECGGLRCNLQTDYCDKGLGICGRCSSLCEPGRIRGDQYAEQDCQQKCSVYMSIQPTTVAANNRGETQVSLNEDTSTHKFEADYHTKVSKQCDVYCGLLACAVAVLLFLAVISSINLCLNCESRKRMIKATTQGYVHLSWQQHEPLLQQAQCTVLDRLGPEGESRRQNKNLRNATTHSVPINNSIPLNSFGETDNFDKPVSEEVPGGTAVRLSNSASQETFTKDKSIDTAVPMESKRNANMLTSI